MIRIIKVWLLSLAVGLVVSACLIDLSVSAHEGHRHAPASAKKLKNPLTATEENIEAGRALFNRNCASCHGDDGKAKTDVAAAMKVKPTDLTGHEMHGITDGEIYWVITSIRTRLQNETRAHFDGIVGALDSLLEYRVKTLSNSNSGGKKDETLNVICVGSGGSCCGFYCLSAANRQRGR